MEQLISCNSHECKVARHCVIKELECLHLTGSSFEMILLCPSLCKLVICGMKYLVTCKVVSPVLSELCVKYCPLLDVSSMLLPSFTSIDISNGNVSSMGIWFDVDMNRRCVLARSRCFQKYLFVIRSLHAIFKTKEPKILVVGRGMQYMQHYIFALVFLFV